MNIISHRILRHLFLPKRQIYSSKTKRCLKQFNRTFTMTKESKYEIYYLKSRSLVQVRGGDTTSFLQGLITSDVSKLNERCISQYSMMLNVQGRVLYDLILYLLPTNQNKESGETTILIECDTRIKDEFIQTMNKYKIRKKVTISDVSDTVKVFSSQNYNNTGIECDDKIKLVTQDPRIPDLGHRILATDDFHTGDVSIDDDIKYKECRYKLGIGEGIEDLPPGNSFPLESNVVFLNGVSFEKGCYLGQELTARTYYTGVTRKRLMPLLFHSEIVDVSHGSTILSEKPKSVGKFRQAVNQYGLGLMRVAEAKGKLYVTDNNNEKLVCTTKIPSWWPTGENHEL